MEVWSREWPWSMVAEALCPIWKLGLLCMCRTKGFGEDCSWRIFSLVASADGQEQQHPSHPHAVTRHGFHSKVMAHLHPQDHASGYLFYFLGGGG